MDLVDRARGMILHPREQWGVIDTEQSTAGELYRGYVMPLAAIGPVATMVGTAVFGVSVPFLGTARVSFGAAAAQAIASYALTLVGVYVLALIIDTLAPTFGGARSATQALKVAVYASTPVWLAGISSLLPALSPLGILGLYSIYLLYLGLPVLMKAPEQRALPYTAAAMIIAIVISVVVGAIAAAVIAPFYAV